MYIYIYIYILYIYIYIYIIYECAGHRQHGIDFVISRNLKNVFSCLGLGVGECGWFETTYEEQYSIPDWLRMVPSLGYLENPDFHFKQTHFFIEYKRTLLQTSGS